MWVSCLDGRKSEGKGGKNQEDQSRHTWIHHPRASVHQFIPAKARLGEKLWIPSKTPQNRDSTRRTCQRREAGIEVGIPQVSVTHRVFFLTTSNPPLTSDQALLVRIHHTRNLLIPMVENNPTISNYSHLKNTSVVPTSDGARQASSQIPAACPLKGKSDRCDPRILVARAGIAMGRMQTRDLILWFELEPSCMPPTSEA